jgi:hypothetical protein
MSELSRQIHHRFKAFSGKLAADHTLGELAGRVAQWAHEARVAPKSIGVEYLEGAQMLVLTVGYRDDEAPYEIELRSVHVGKIDQLVDAELRGLEAAMEGASRGLAHILCHELYVTDENEFVMVFMVQKAA